MPKARGKNSKKAAPASVAAKEDISDPLVAANGLEEDALEDVIAKPDASLSASDVGSLGEAPVKATNSRGGGRGKKAEKLEKEEVPAKKVAAASKGRGGRGKKSDDVEVINTEAEDNAQSNGVALASVDEAKQDEVVAKAKGGGKGKRVGKVTTPKEEIAAAENGEANGKVEPEENEKLEVATKTSRGRGGKKLAEKAAKNVVEESTAEEETTKAVEPELKAVPKKGSGRKKVDEKVVTEVIVGKVANEEDSTEVAEEAPKKKGRGGRKAPIADKVEETNNIIEEQSSLENNEASKKSSKKRGKAEQKKSPVDNKSSKRGANLKEEPKDDAESAIEEEEEDIVEEEKSQVEKKSSRRGAKVVASTKEDVVETDKKPAKRGRAAAAKTANAEEAENKATLNEEIVPKKRSRKEISAKKEIKPEVDKPKKARGTGSKHKEAKKQEDEVKEQPQDENEIKDEEEEVSTVVTEDSQASSKKVEKAAATSGRGSRKRAAPSTNKSKTDVDEETDKNAEETNAIVDDDDDDEADDSKSSKAKKKKKEAPPKAARLNSIVTTYNKEDFQLAPLTDGQTADEPRFNLKISSWNVAGLRSWLKKEGLRFLEYEEPDIFCLQETKCTTDQLPDEVARIPGYHPYWLCMPGGHAGVAIYSKIMPINVEYGIGHKEFDDAGRVITAEYEKFFLVNVYVPNSGRKLVNLDPRMKWEKLFQEFIQKLNDRKPVVICGDMNVSHQEIDLANPKSNTRSAGFTKEERDKMTELLALGYVDTFRHLYPDRKGAYTFWTYMGNARARNVGWRLDYFIVSERFVKRVVENCMRSQCMGSDHCPITLFLKL